MPDDSSQRPTPPVPSPKPPVPRLDRSGLERVLARAAELQSGPGDTDENFTEEQLLELGREVGLSPQNLRQALAEERTRSIAPEEEHGFTASLFGPSRVHASRTVPGRAPEALAAIDAWMQRQELLIVKRHHSDRIVWEPRRDFLVGIKRALKVGGRDYALSQAFEVSATVLAIDDTQVHVSLDADFRSQRSRSTQQAVASSVIGGAATVSLAVIGVAAVLAAAPIVILSATGIAGARALQGRVVTRAQLALEQLLDRLERGEFVRRSPDSLLGAIVAAATAIPPRRF
ncbi:MAG: hypothetical protein JWM41_3558 [Gemmatimonadetes bacterium]|nr:hypothetical protein [Gemmatimonadota bacterium]